MNPSRESYDIEDLKQAARRSADAFKVQLLENIEKYSNDSFDWYKNTFCDAFMGMRYLSIFLVKDIDLRDDFMAFTRALEQEIKAICWNKDKCAREVEHHD